MKLSDAVVLGLSLVEFTPDCYLNAGCGCLIGAGYAASTGKTSEYYRRVISEWPWLTQKFPVPNVIKKYEAERDATADSIISSFAHLLAWKVVTLDECIQWIKANEPKDCAAGFTDDDQNVERTGVSTATASRA